MSIKKIANGIKNKVSKNSISIFLLIILSTFFISNIIYFK